MKLKKVIGAQKTETAAETDSSFKTSSPLMRDIYEKVKSVSRLEKHLILIGEIGVGKKNLAQAIHRNSSRSDGPFLSFYCMSTNEDEVKEAFWETVSVENGHLQLKFEVLEDARNGTLYLNKFSELTSEFMMNIIDSYLHGCHQLFRYSISSSPRLIISISQDSFQQLVKTDTWEKMIVALNAVSIILPPLRERPEDIHSFVEIFLSEVREANPTWNHLKMTTEALQECISFNWPGNVRQLKNAIMQGALLSRGNTIECRHLPFSMNWQFPY